MAKKIDKRQLRKQIKTMRGRLSDGFRRKASEAVCRHIERSASFASARSIAIYSAVAGEVDLAPLWRSALAAGKRVHLPILLAGRRRIMRFVEVQARTPLTTNRFGIPEPLPKGRIYASPGKLDLVLTPVVAFDRCGHRVGLGAGYYDRCFGFLRSRGGWRRPKLLGVAYSFQETDIMEPDPWDVPLWRIVTEKGVLQPARTPLGSDT